MEIISSPFRTWLLALIAVLAQLSVRGATEDTLRLEPRIRPVTQAIDLQLDPSAEGYTGSTRVELRFEIETNTFWFHAQEIGLGRAALDGEDLILKTGEAGMVSARANASIKPGVHVFEVAFTNDYNRDGTGLYKAVTGEKPYLFTQMEAIDARRAFPCWDEPDFKMPWRVKVTIPKGVEIVGNMPIAQRAEEGDRQIVEFGQSPPMPSYLVALAVGPFDFVPIPGQPVPGRVVTVAGKKALAQVTVDETPALLRALERYFGLPFPYPKLDHIAIPEFNWGGMENAGPSFIATPVCLKIPRISASGHEEGSWNWLLTRWRTCGLATW